MLQQTQQLYYGQQKGEGLDSLSGRSGWGDANIPEEEAVLTMCIH